MFISETPLDRQFAACMRRFDPAMEPCVEWAARLASNAVGEGHVCLDLRAWAGREVAPGLRLPSLSTWKQSLFSSTVVGKPGEFKPMIIEGDRLYLARYWHYEKKLAENLLARAGDVCGECDLDRLASDLDSLFAHNSGQSDWQKTAAAIAVQRRFCVISGGPGTGKTTTVVRILAALQSQANGGLRIALAAPTGKAAARMQDSIRVQKHKLDLPAAIVNSIPESASTLHRLLGFKPDSVYFRHNRDNPLPVDVVVVDESSMIDLALLSKLLESLPSKARLIMLGDKDQLAAVEAGAVFGDLCAGRGYSAELAPPPNGSNTVDTAVHTGREQIPPTPLFQRGVGGIYCRNDEQKPLSIALTHALGGGEKRAVSPLGDCIALLKHSHRFGSGSGIGELARRVNEAEDPSAVLELLSEGRFYDIAWRAHFDETDLLAKMDAGYKDYFDKVAAGAGREAMAAFNRFRVLAAHHAGPSSAYSTNRAFEALMRERLRVPQYMHWYAGRPVIVTRNDYGLKVFNGDVGICLRVDGELRVCFEDAEGKLRSLAPTRLPVHEPVYAMTVHKSQGSEFDEALLLLPETISPVLNRALAYTAITRAKSRAEIWGGQDILVAAVRNAPERSSGLRERLWG